MTVEDKQEQLQCPLCGHKFDPEDAGEMCQNCPLNKKSCGMAKCPNCGYDFPVVEDPSLFSWAKKLFRGDKEE